MAADERTKDILDFYTRARAAADEAIESLDIDATGTAFAFFDGVTVSLRWALIHMLEESAVHGRDRGAISCWRHLNKQC